MWKNESGIYPLQRRKHLMNSVKRPLRSLTVFAKKTACTLVVLATIHVLTGICLAEEVSSTATESKETAAPSKPAETESMDERIEIADQLSDEGLMTLNFLQVSIREVLSALAMKREINIVMAQEVSGKISVHLYMVTLEEALEAITLAGGFSYHKRGNLYYVSKSKKTIVSPKPAKTKSIDERVEIADQLSDEGLMTLNFFQIGIREVLSALAMKREINIAMAQAVSGKISVHLYMVTLEEALEAITLAGGFSYHKYGNLYYVYKPKEAKEPETKNLQIRFFKLKYANIEKIQEVLDAIPGLRMVKIHEPSKTIIVEDTPKNIKKIEIIISYWDKIPKQVMIEAKILKVDLTDDMSLGVNWEKMLGDVRIGTGGFSTATIPTTGEISPVPTTGAGIFGNIITGAGTRTQFTAALDALKTKTKVNTLSTPKILAIHGKLARVQVGGQQGYNVTTTSMGVSTETVEFIDTGTILEITPYIDDEGNVLLNVKPSINSVNIEGGIPVVTSTTVSTWLLAKDGETVFIGGLIEDIKTQTSSAIPCLGSIPLLNLVFGRTSQGIGKSELVVLITPKIISAEKKSTDKEAIEKIKKMEESFKKNPPAPPKEVF